jgi:hypothetical protein
MKICLNGVNAGLLHFSYHYYKKFRSVREATEEIKTNKKMLIKLLRKRQEKAIDDLREKIQNTEKEKQKNA